jgi:hypothetical protein
MSSPISSATPEQPPQPQQAIVQSSDNSDVLIVSKDSRYMRFFKMLAVVSGTIVLKIPFQI